jgi:hypothetical protein
MYRCSSCQIERLVIFFAERINVNDVLFVDDEKLPEWFGLDKKTAHAKTSSEARAIWDKGEFKILYLDHDLGVNGLMDGSQVLSWICSLSHKPEKVFCISLNPVGVERIAGVCHDFEIPMEDIGRREMFRQFTSFDGQSG